MDLSQDSQCLRLTSSSSPWWTNSLKLARFIALPKLPSDKELAEIMVNHVFGVHGFPSNIVSDRRPQFSTRFLGKNFANSWEPPWVSPLDTTRSSMVRTSASSIWKLAFHTSCPKVLQHGASTGSGLNMPTTHYLPLWQGFPHSSVHLVKTLQFLPPKSLQCLCPSLMPNLLLLLHLDSRWSVPHSQSQLFQCQLKIFANKETVGRWRSG